MQILNSGEPFIGEVRMFAGNSEPPGWMFCDGSLLSIKENLALFGVIGTTYGGDGVNNFAVPDLRGRGPLGQGPANGLSNRILGQQVGAESVILNTGHLPAHAHSVQGTNTAGNAASPGGNVLAAPMSNDSIYHSSGATLVNLGANTGSIGSGSPVPTIQPSLVLNFIIALQGQDPRGAAVRIIAKTVAAAG